MGGNAIPSISAKYNSSVTLPVPTYTGFRFVGWYYIDDSSKTFGKLEQMPPKDITLYAKWKTSGIEV